MSAREKQPAFEEGSAIVSHMKSSQEVRSGFGCVRPLSLATALTTLAGFLDATAFIALDHLYVSFMSGNSTQLGISLTLGNLRDTLSIAVVIIAFVLGAVCGTRISDNGNNAPIVCSLATETAFRLAAMILALAHQTEASLVLVAAAMGLQNCLHQLVGGADVGKGFITGALFSFGQSLARFGDGISQWRTAGSNLLSWLAFVVGAVSGAVALDRIGITACVGAACLFAFAVLAAVRFRLL